MTRVVATASSLPRITMGMPVGVKGVARVTVAAETLMHWDRGVQRATSLCLVD